MRWKVLRILAAKFGAEHPNVAPVLSNLADIHRLTNALDQAKGLYERGLAIKEGALGPDHPTVAFPLIGLAEVALLEDRPGEAIELANRAARIRASAGLPADRVGTCQFILARALWEAPPSKGRDRGRALRLARQVRGAYRGVKGKEDELGEVDTWLAAHAEP